MAWNDHRQLRHVLDHVQNALAVAVLAFVAAHNFQATGRVGADIQQTIVALQASHLCHKDGFHRLRF